ncbi:MAG: hypothetical protein ACKPKO_24115, partial [Candidatus Fonsibacter sp.]
MNQQPSIENGLDLVVDTGGWFLVNDVVGAFNEFVRNTTHRRTRLPEWTLAKLVQLASEGTEDSSKLLWQFCVWLIKQLAGRRLSFFHRIKEVFGICVVVGHTGMPLLEDDRLMVDLKNVPDEHVPFVVHNTRIENLPSIIKRG